MHLKSKNPKSLFCPYIFLPPVNVDLVQIAPKKIYNLINPYFQSISKSNLLTLNMGKKKAFINHNEGQSFSLLHRSQRDPLVANNDVGERILAPITKNKRKHEQQKFGVYFEDDYNYLQHLRDRNELIADDIEDRTVLVAAKPAIQLPSTIFETKGGELKVGMLNQAAPSSKIDFNVDPEIAAALEEDGDFEQLDDDFMQMANDDDAPMVEEKINPFYDEKEGRAEIMSRFGLHREKLSDSDTDGEEEDEFDDFEDDVPDFDGCPNGRRAQIAELMTCGSISSSCMPRNEGKRTIDAHFDKICEEYGDDQIGYGGSDVEEEPEEDELTQAQWKEKLDELHGMTKIKFETLEKPDENIKAKTLKLAEQESKNPEALERVVLEPSGRKRNHWDAETILSTYSTQYNHPTVIREPSKKKRGISKKDLDALNRMEISNIDKVSVISGTSVSTYRPRGETAEERRQRKMAVKEQQRERRMEKKLNKQAFNEQRLSMHTQAVRAPVKGKTIY